MMKFSIITVCLNAGDDLIDTVTSTLNQTYEDFEIIVKDGLSTDGSVERLPADPRIRLIRQKDTGIYDAMNQGIDEATGDYLIFMNAGDLFYDCDVLGKIKECIHNERSGLYYGLCYNRKMDYINAYPRKLTRMTCYRTMICHQSTVFLKGLFEEKKYNSVYKILADRDYLMWVICKKKIRAVYMDLIVVNYKADGACEDEDSNEQNKKDIKRMNTEYLGKAELLLFRFLHLLTLPRIRSKLVGNKKLSRIYMKTVQFLYRNRT